MSDIAVVGHFLQHEVAPAYRTLGVAHGAESRWCVDHTCHQGTLFDIEVFGRFVEEGFGGCTDAIGVVTKSNGVEIHRHDFFLRIVVFQLSGRNPFLKLT